MENIYLIGFMGTGKSTVAKEMSKLLPLRVVEMDETIEMLASESISDIFSNKGEAAFRDMETMFLNAISKEKNQIISCGGGIVLRDENIDTMKKSGVVCLLEASPEVICDRVNNSNNRPLLENKKTVEDIKAILDSRQERYQKAADLTFDVSANTPMEIASEIIKALALKGYLH